MRRYRAVVVGLNHFHGPGWVESLAALNDQIEVVSRYDADPARAGAIRPDHVDPALPQRYPEWFQNLPFHDDLNDLVETHRPDLAVVLLPNDVAPAAITHLANAGVHLLLDKPTARTAAEAIPAFAAVDQNGVQAAVALTRRYGTGWQEAAAAIAAGEIGSLVTTEAVFVTSSVTVRDPGNLIFDRERMGGGVLHWLGIHDLDALQWLTGEPIVAVQAMTAAPGTPGVEVEEVVSASVRYASGAIGTVHYAYALPRPAGDGYVAIRGTRGSIKILADGSWTLMLAGTLTEPLMSRTTTYESRPSSGYGAVGSVILADLLQAMAGGSPPRASGNEIVSALQVVDAMYAAAASGTVVEVQGRSQ